MKGIKIEGRTEGERKSLGRKKQTDMVTDKNNGRKEKDQEKDKLERKKKQEMKGRKKEGNNEERRQEETKTLDGKKH